MIYRNDDPKAITAMEQDRLGDYDPGEADENDEEYWQDQQDAWDADAYDRMRDDRLTGDA